MTQDTPETTPLYEWATTYDPSTAAWRYGAWGRDSVEGHHTPNQIGPRFKTSREAQLCVRALNLADFHPGV